MSSEGRPLLSDVEQRLDLPPPGGVAWLEITADSSESWSRRVRRGPLGVQISRLAPARAPYYFKGARLRGMRCAWAAATVSGAALTRQARPDVANEPFVHMLVRVECAGSVFEPSGQSGRGTLLVIDPAGEIREQFAANTHLYTINVVRGTLGVEAAMLAEMIGQSYEVTPLQVQVLRAGIGLLLAGSDEFTTSASLVGVDRYLGAMAGLLLRTAVRRPVTDVEQMEAIRSSTDTIIFEQAADPMLSPATIAAQLSISLRQLYRAFSGAESPAARIRRRRLEHAAELLVARSAPTQVERIAQECGFVSAEYFSRAFRREFGLSPRAYRSAHRDRPSGEPGTDEPRSVPGDRGLSSKP